MKLPDKDPVLEELEGFSACFQENKNIITNTVMLAPSTVQEIEQLGVLCPLLTFGRQASIAPDALLQGVDGTEFLNRTPVAKEAQLIQYLHSLAHHKVPQWDRSLGLWKFMKEETVKLFFDQMLPPIQKISSSAIQILQNQVLQSDLGQKFQEKPADGWPEGEYDKLLPQMDDLRARLVAYQPEGIETAASITQLTQWVQELRAATDITLTEEERALKTQFQEHMNQMIESFPAWTQAELMAATYPDIEAELANRPSIATSAAGFVQHCGQSMGPKATIKLAQLGAAFERQVKETHDYMKILLACQSAIQVVTSNDPSKAAAFEEKRLTPRGLSMDFLPQSVQDMVVGLSKR